MLYVHHNTVADPRKVHRQKIYPPKATGGVPFALTNPKAQPQGLIFTFLSDYAYLRE